MYCGCSYELFWHLNPKKLKPFAEAKQKEIDNNFENIKIASHQTGLYIRYAVASVFGSAEYPEVPFGTEETAEEQWQGSNDKDKGAKTLTDAEKFEMWMIVHNQQLKQKRAKQKKAGEG